MRGPPGDAPDIRTLIRPSVRAGAPSPWKGEGRMCTRGECVTRHGSRRAAFPLPGGRLNDGMKRGGGKRTVSQGRGLPLPSGRVRNPLPGRGKPLPYRFFWNGEKKTAPAYHAGAVSVTGTIPPESPPRPACPPPRPPSGPGTPWRTWGCSAGQFSSYPGPPAW